MSDNASYQWSFLRLAGLDQLTLQTSEELSHLGDLDPKLWSAMSCPASGLEFDPKTLKLLDANNDGRIRIPEVVEAADWLCARIKDPSEAVGSPKALPLSSIKDDTDYGAKLLATAHNVLAGLGKSDAGSLTKEDVSTAVAAAAQKIFNGDGIFPPQDGIENDLKEYIAFAIQTVGGVQDASGAIGLDTSHSELFLSVLEEHKNWREAVKHAPCPLGENTAAAWSALGNIRQKIDDYFSRCRLAEYAPISAPGLNEEEQLKTPKESGLLDTAALAELPVSHVEAGSLLDIGKGLNPAWKDQIVSFFTLTAAFLGDPAKVTEAEWKKIQESLAPYGAVLASRPNAPAEGGNAVLDSFSDDDINRILDSDLHARFTEMADRDLSVPAAVDDVAELEKLTLYYMNLHRMLMNYASFYEFYSLTGNATFQAGTLYIDGRSCTLCIPVQDIEAHAAMAQHSQLFLLYCACKRSDGAAQTMNIMAAMTAGSDSSLIEGRNGVFVDINGNLWDATVVKIIRNPISLKQAMWSPYLAISRTIGDNIAKFAAAKREAAQLNAVAKVTAAPTAQKPAFDMGKNVGIFAAVGLALGAIGTALGSLANAVVSMSWWQFPLVLLGIFLCISGPAVFLAWLKLRKRTLAPVLEASGWALNSKLPINLPLGKYLSKSAVLPPNSKRTFNDTLDQKSHTVRNIAVMIAAALLVVLVWLGATGKLSEWFPQPQAPEVTEPAPEAAPAPAAEAPADPAPAQ